MTCHIYHRKLWRIRTFCAFPYLSWRQIRDRQTDGQT